MNTNIQEKEYRVAERKNTIGKFELIFDTNAAAF